MNQEAVDLLESIVRKDVAQLITEEMQVLVARRDSLTEDQLAKFGDVIAETLKANAGGSETGDETSYDSFTKAQLQAELKSREIPFETDANKAALIALLETADAEANS